MNSLDLLHTSYVTDPFHHSTMYAPQFSWVESNIISIMFDGTEVWGHTAGE
jgi:hypothetical protein